MKWCVLAKIFGFGSKQHRFDKFKSQNKKKVQMTCRLFTTDLLPP